MKSSLVPGMSSVTHIVVDDARTVGIVGEECRIYAKPHLIADIETACRDLILAHSEANEDSVGMEVAVKHFAPTLPGMTVEITVEVTAVEGRKVTFAVIVEDEFDTITTGSHTRFVAERAKIIRRLTAKAVRLTARRD
jgi:fluoroacetyl-CoA thioesterase